MRTARVEFPTGRELLSAYWGFLGPGGLVLRQLPLGGDPSVPVGEEPAHDGAAAGGAGGEGAPVRIEVHITSLRKLYSFSGRLRVDADGRAVLSFDPGQQQDVLVAAAWADAQGVPERRHRRWNIEIPVRFRTFDREGAGLLVNLSRGGCCLRVDADIASGARIYVVGGDFLVDGLVRWSRGGCRLLGIEFAHFHEELVGRIADQPEARGVPVTP